MYLNKTAGQWRPEESQDNNGSTEAFGNAGYGSGSFCILRPSLFPFIPIALDGNSSSASAHAFAPLVVSHQFGFVCFGQRLCMF
jgi:hypothetical protein